MSESLVNTKRRIATIRSTKKITKAMKLVASVKYQRWKKMYEDNFAYANAMKETMSRTISGIDFSDSKKPEAMVSYETGKSLYVVVSSSLGLCGAYNYNLFKALDPVLKDEDEIMYIGQKAATHFASSAHKTYDDFQNLLDSFSYSAVRRLRHLLVRMYKTGNYSKVVLVYTQYKNSLTFLPTFHTLLPLIPEEEGIDAKKEESLETPLFEPNLDAILNQILPHYLDASIYQKLMESEISELASRRNAMETATDSADKIQAKLQLEYNKARQNAITQEITEVVAGANASKEEE